MDSRSLCFGVSHKGSRERCLPVFINETEKRKKQNHKNGRKTGTKGKKTETKKKGRKNGTNGKKTGQKRKKNRKIRKRLRSGDPFCEIPITVEPPTDDLGLIFSKMIRISIRKSELPAENRRYSGFLKRALAQTCFRVWCQVRFFTRIFGHSWGLVYREGPGTVPLHNLRVTSHVLHQEVPLEWYRVRLFWIVFWAFSGALGRGEGAPLVRYLCKTQKSLHGRHV